MKYLVLFCVMLLSGIMFSQGAEKRVDFLFEKKMLSENDYKEIKMALNQDYSAKGDTKEEETVPSIIAEFVKKNPKYESIVKPNAVVSSAAWGDVLIDFVFFISDKLLGTNFLCSKGDYANFGRATSKELIKMKEEASGKD